MSRAAEKPILIAIDLGAESCRVSLLRWSGDIPKIELVHRLPNGAVERADGLRWNIGLICLGVEEGIRKCAQMVAESGAPGIQAIAVDGWAVDYVRLGSDGRPLADPYCYRDSRNTEAELALHAIIPASRLRDFTGVQIQKINTLYQQYADVLGGEEPGELWLNLPEYLLHRWGGKAVAERTNATHTQMIDLKSGDWSPEILEAARLDIARMPPLVSPGTHLGKLDGPLSQLPALRHTRLLAPCCHDTASAIAGIAAEGDDWAYLSSGTWSLIGTLLDAPCNVEQSKTENFTNLAAAGGRYCFHKNLNGMWLIRQCIESWAAEGRPWSIADLIAAARKAPNFPVGQLLDVDDSELLLPGRMPQRLNEQRARHGLQALPAMPEAAPAVARLVFQSLAHRYQQVLSSISALSGKTFRHLFIVGGGSQNELLNDLTAQATGLTVHRGSTESSTLGNFATQLATLEEDNSAANITLWARRLTPVRHEAIEPVSADQRIFHA